MERSLKSPVQILALIGGDHTEDISFFGDVFMRSVDHLRTADQRRFIAPSPCASSLAMNRWRDINDYFGGKSPLEAYIAIASSTIQGDPDVTFQELKNKLRELTNQALEIPKTPQERKRNDAEFRSTPYFRHLLRTVGALTYAMPDMKITWASQPNDEFTDTKKLISTAMAHADRTLLLMGNPQFVEPFGVHAQKWVFNLGGAIQRENRVIKELLIELGVDALVRPSAQKRAVFRIPRRNLAAVFWDPSRSGEAWANVVITQEFDPGIGLAPLYHEVVFDHLSTEREYTPSVDEAGSAFASWIYERYLRRNGVPIGERRKIVREKIPGSMKNTDLIKHMSSLGVSTFSLAA